ncbi:MAG: ferritin-like domain-containing protein [Crinalium sp.]
MTLPNKLLANRRFGSRRSLIKLGLVVLGIGMITPIPRAWTARKDQGIKSITINDNDLGILNFALLLEEIQSTFYTAVIKSNKITDSREISYISSLLEHQIEHIKYLRELLGNKAIFKSGDLRFNQAGLAAKVSDRTQILNTAVILEDLGVHAYNGIATLIKNPTYLLAISSIVSVEARHAGGVRGLLGRTVTESNRDRAFTKAELVQVLNPFLGRSYDELYTPKQVISIVTSLNILKSPVTGTLIA